MVCKEELVEESKDAEEANVMAVVSEVSPFLLTLLGQGVIKVVKRVDVAKENNTDLDLSHCQLTRVPDAVYFLLRDTHISTLDVAHNVITSISGRMPKTFSNITHLNVSHNRLSSLPSEMSLLQRLEHIDLSFNAFIDLPQVLFRDLSSLQSIVADKNFINNVDMELLESSCSVRMLSLLFNPLSRECEAGLKAVECIEVKMTEKEMEEWENL